MLLAIVVRLHSLDVCHQVLHFHSAQCFKHYRQLRCNLGHIAGDLAYASLPIDTMVILSTFDNGSTIARTTSAMLVMSLSTTAACVHS